MADVDGLENQVAIHCDGRRAARKRATQAATRRRTDLSDVVSAPTVGFAFGCKAAAEEPPGTDHFEDMVSGDWPRHQAGGARAVSEGAERIVSPAIGPTRDCQCARVVWPRRYFCKGVVPDDRSVRSNKGLVGTVAETELPNVIPAPAVCDVSNADCTHGLITRTVPAAVSDDLDRSGRLHALRVRHRGPIGWADRVSRRWVTW